MKTKILIALIVTPFLILHSAFGQGALTPPGAPGPTMKTLTQVEPRTPISSAPFTIANPGSYFLTTNIVSSFSDAIIIATNQVTLDLNGFTISSSYSGNAGSGIWLDGANMNIAIFNGHIISGITNNGSGVYSGPGFFNGITYTGPTPQNVRVSDLTVWGLVYYGINVGNGNSTLVENCQVLTVGSYGIIGSTVKSSLATDIGGTAIFGDQVDGCRGESTASGDGIFCNNALNCYGSGSGSGIYCNQSAQICTGLGNGSGNGISANYLVLNCYGSAGGTGNGIACFQAQNSYGSANTGDGLAASGNALNCYGSSSTGTAISATTAMNCEGYANSGSGSGIMAATAENCYGNNGSSGYGIYATVAALNCDGFSFTGTGLYAVIANGSRGNTLTTTHNVNSFVF